MIIQWACPQYGAPALAHGRGSCLSPEGQCDGLLCECEDIASNRPTHGESFATPCLNASCYHCGWSGQFPAHPKGLAPWEKKALDAGWQPPPKRARELEESKKPKKSKKVGAGR